MIEESNIAVVIIFYNRIELVKEFFKQNDHILFDSHLRYNYYIDYYNDSVQSEIDLLIKEKYQNLKLNYTIVKRKSRYGLRRNILTSIHESAKDSSYILVLEEDINLSTIVNYEFLKNTINQMSGLVKHVNLWSLYEDKSANWNMTAIMHCWGWLGESKEIVKFVETFAIRKKIKFEDYYKLTNSLNNHDNAKQLLYNFYGYSETWAIYWALHLIMNDYSSLVPRQSLVENIGLSSGENFNENKNASKYKVAKATQFYHSVCIAQQEYERIHKSKFSKGLLSKIFCLFVYPLLKIAYYGKN